MGRSLDQVCQNYPAALDLDLLVLNVLRIVVLAAGAHGLVPVALIPVVEYFRVRNWPGRYCCLKYISKLFELREVI